MHPKFSSSAGEGTAKVLWEAKQHRKARQTGLNRIVAVKMILAGQLATDADVKRFRTEAEAAANLRHPNIVAIHERSEHEGRHYFWMLLWQNPPQGQSDDGRLAAPSLMSSVVTALSSLYSFVAIVVTALALSRVLLFGC